jgi:hypothetical protein
MRSVSAFIAPLALVSLALSGCSFEAAFQEGDEPVAEASQALSTSQLATYSTSPLEVPNGKKIVLVGGVLHAAYRSGPVVQYTSSTDGITWTAPLTVDSTSSQNPTIAVANDGTVFVAYVRNGVGGVGDLYLAKKTGASFGAPFQVTSNTDDDTSRTPSIVASGNTFYLAWARATAVKYVSFPSSQATSLPSAELVRTPTGDAAYQPAIMVGPGPSGLIIRVALVEHRPATVLPLPPGPAGYTLFIQERGVSTWAQMGTDSADYASSGQLVSVSADANPSTGDSYVAVSRTVDGVSSTAFIRENMLTPGYSSAFSQLFTTTAPLVSVAARTEGCQSRFRIVSSTPTSSFGAATYRTGTWTSGAAPTWIDAAPVSLPGTSRTGTALLQSVAIPGTLNSRYFYGTYEDRLGLAFRIFDAYDTAPTGIPCN